MRLFDVLFAKSLSGGSQPTDDWNVKIKYNGIRASNFNIIKLDLSSGISFIDDMAFQGCDSLTELVIPEGVETIGSQAFYTCKSLRKLKLPSTLKSIGGYCFGGVSRCLTIVDMTAFDGSSIPTLSSNTFYGNIGTSTRFIFSDQTVLDAFAASSWSRLSSLFEVAT